MIKKERFFCQNLVLRNVNARFSNIIIFLRCYKPVLFKWEHITAENLKVIYSDYVKTYLTLKSFRKQFLLANQKQPLAWHTGNLLWNTV